MGRLGEGRVNAARHAFVYLASQSPRRRQLLEQLGVRYRLLLPIDADAAEALEAWQPGELPTAYVQRVTRLKLAAALRPPLRGSAFTALSSRRSSGGKRLA